MEPRDLKLKEGSVLLGEPLWTVADVQFFSATWLSDEDMQEVVVAFVASESTWKTVLTQLEVVRETPHFPRIVAVSDTDQAVVYRPPEGGFLQDRLEAYRHPSRAFPLLQDVARALISLHRRGYVLSGIRPSQVWVDEGGRGVLLRLPPWPSPGDPVSYLDYAEGFVAPEVLFGGDVGPASDVYVLGALLYKLIFGKDPADFFSPNVRSPLREIYRAPWPGVVQVLVQSLALQRDRFPDVEAWSAYVESIYRLEYAPRLTLDVGVFSSIGRNPSRLHNEDAYAYTLHYHQSHERGWWVEGLFMVADGMGGGAKGEEAARTALEVMEAVLRDAEFTEESVRRALQEANRRVYARAQEIYGDAWEAYMGTTVAGVWTRWPRTLVFNVGDTRIYLIRDGQCEQLSVDHSALAQAGGVDPRGHPSRHELVYAVGPWDHLPPEGMHIAALRLERGDQLLLLTDGVWEAITDEEMIRWGAETPSPQDLARRMVRVAVERGGQDNATAMVIRVPKAGGVV